MAQFNCYIGIDYSGAESPDSSCKGLRVYVAEGSGEPIQVQPPPSPRRYWTRSSLVQVLAVFFGLRFCSHLCAWNAAFISSSGSTHPSTILGYGCTQPQESHATPSYPSSLTLAIFRFSSMSTV
jgi:hypothetical protein